MFFVTGSPGSGKDTKLNNLVKKYNFSKIKAYDCISKSVNSRSDTGLKIKAFMDKGELVSSELTCKALDEEMT